MRKIPVSSREYGIEYAIVDDEDFDMLCGYTWDIKYKNGRGQRVRTVVTYYNTDGKLKYRDVSMHHAVIGQPPIGMDTHHINGNPLDNRKENLEVIPSLEHSYISCSQESEWDW